MKEKKANHASRDLTEVVAASLQENNNMTCTLLSFFKCPRKLREFLAALHLQAILSFSAWKTRGWHKLISMCDW